MARQARSFETVRGAHGAYVLGDRLGVGGIGVVYEALAPALGQRVAIKFLGPAAVVDPQLRQRFDDEALVGRVVNHPNVVRVLDLGQTTTGAPFFVMELAPGEPLGALVGHDGPMSVARAVAVTSQILAGVASLHDAGIVHGDLKSDNVLVETRGGRDHVKLIDFGLARVQFSPAEPTAPEAGDRLSGTPDYMAPEVIRGEGPTFASDVYAVGIILYELLTGSPPFTGGTSTDVVLRHLHDDVVPPSLRCAHTELPRPLEAVVMRALAKQPRDRPPGAAAFAAELAVIGEALVDGDVLTSGGVGAHDRAAADTPTLVGSAGPRVRHGRGRRRPHPGRAAPSSALNPARPRGADRG